MKGRSVCCIMLAGLLLILCGCFAGSSRKGEFPGRSFQRMNDGRMVGFHPMLMDFLGARMIFVGEIHDNPRHHQLQLEVIKGLHRSGAKIAVAVEMFRAESQPWLDRWIAGDLDIVQFMELYRDNWTIPWELYDSIFLYARNNGIPLLGLNAPIAVMQKVYRQGFAALSPEEKALLPPEISCNVDKSYMDFVRRNYVWHSSDLSTFNYFCEAQLLRDRYMAHVLKRYRERYPDRTVVILAGIGHAMRSGIPDELAGLVDGKTRILIPPLGPIAAESLSDGDADYTMRE